MIPGSAAAKAGIEPGDQITEISSVKLTALHIEQCKRLLQEEHVRITIAKHISAKDQKMANKVLDKARARAGSSPNSSRRAGATSAGPDGSRGSPSPSRSTATGGAAYDAIVDTAGSKPTVATGEVVYDASLGRSDAAVTAESLADEAAKSKLYAQVDKKSGLRPRQASRNQHLEGDDENAGNNVYEVPVEQPAPAVSARPSLTKLALQQHGSDDTADNDSEELYEAPQPGAPTAPKLYDVVTRREGDDQPLYTAPVAGGAGVQKLYSATTEDDGEPPMYEAPCKTRAAAQKLYEPTGYAAKYGKSNNDDEDDQLYEVTAGNASLRTGYGGEGQEPLYETIPGEKVTPRQSRCVSPISTALVLIYAA